MTSIEQLQIQQSLEQGGDFSYEVEAEQLTRPLLERAGILDLNHAFETLPQARLAQGGLFPDVDTTIVANYLTELRSGISRILDVNEYIRTPTKAIHDLYPLIQGGFIHQIAETSLFQRLYEVHQLGINRFYPMANPHTRGEHSVYLTINMSRNLQALYDKDRELLVNKLRDDFIREGLLSIHAKTDEVVHTAVDLTVLTGMLHDSATPAGGDTIKYLLGLNEEKDAQWLLTADTSVFAKEREELLTLLSERGLGKEHLAYVVRAIQGSSNTLIGQMIHPANADEIDFDRTAYTLLDAQVVDMLSGQGLPTVLQPQRLGALEQELLLARLATAIEALQDNNNAVLSVAPTDTRYGREYSYVPTDLLDISEDYILTGEGKLVCTRPDLLAWITAYRIWMTGIHYAGPKMLGLEWELQSRLQTILAKGVGESILNKEALLSMTDQELFAALSNLDDPVLQEILDRNTRFAGTTTFRGELIDQDQEPRSDSYASFPVKIKPGLDTLVQTNHGHITLREWVKNNPHAIASRAIMAGLDTFRDKQVVIYTET